MLALDVVRRGDIDRARTIYCSTFSRTLTPGLRVGWICAAQELVEKVVLIKAGVRPALRDDDLEAMEVDGRAVLDNNLAEVITGGA